MHSPRSHFVKTSGLRWISLMLLAPIPWAGCVWALPFLTALVPSERFNEANERRHKTPLDFGRQLALQARHCLPGRDLVLVADSSFSSLLFLHALQRRGIMGAILDKVIRPNMIAVLGPKADAGAIIEP